MEEKLFDWADKIIFNKKEVETAIQNIYDELKIIEDKIIVIAIKEGGLFLASQLISTYHTVTTNSYIDNTKLDHDEIYIYSENLPDINGKTIVLIDDIYDTGNTLFKVNQKLKNLGAKEIKNVVLVKRTGPHKYNVPIYTYGLELRTNEFLVGCGMDYNKKYRDLPYIISLK